MRGCGSSTRKVSILAGQLAICALRRSLHVSLAEAAPGPQGGRLGAPAPGGRRGGGAGRDHRAGNAPRSGTNGAVHLETMQAVDHPYVRVISTPATSLLQPRHGRGVGVEKIVDYVATVEFGSQRRLRDVDFPATGAGRGGFPGVDVLNAHGYADPITLEFEGTKGVELDEARPGRQSKPRSPMCAALENSTDAKRIARARAGPPDQHGPSTESPEALRQKEQNHAYQPETGTIPMSRAAAS